MRKLALVMIAATALAAPAFAQTTSYGGLGAPASRFFVGGSGSGGSLRLEIVDNRGGRIASYNVSADHASELSTVDLEHVVTLRALPPDSRQVQGWTYFKAWHGYCAIYESSWLGRVLYGTYAVLYVSSRDQTAAAMVSKAAACRG